MSEQRLPLFKSHYSLGRSILTLDAPFNKEKKPNENSIFYLLHKHEQKTLTLVEDNVSGLLEASKNASDNNIKLIFGLRISITDDVSVKNEDSDKKQAKYIIFAKNTDGYKDLIKIWSFAANEGFYYHANIDFKNLKKLWTKNLILSVPFYDSFLHLNSLEGRTHVPDFSFTNPVFFLENNEIPFDDILKNRVLDFCDKNSFSTLNTQSIYYYEPKDFKAYLTFRCIHARGSSKKSTCEKPELNHMCSDTFNFLRTI